MAGCVRGDSIVNLQAALYSANNHHDNGEYTAIKNIESPELYHDQLIQDQRLISNEDGMLDTIRSYNDTNQYIGDLTIDSSNHVHVGHVFNTIINGTVKTHEKKSESKAECAKKAMSSISTIKNPINSLKDNLKAIVALVVIVLMACATALTSLQFTKDAEPSAYVEEPELQNASLPQETKRFQIFSVSQWGGRRPTETETLRKTATLAVIKHTNTATCADTPSCFSSMQRLQSIDVGTMHEPNIRYNFVIGGDGNIYEGRGWGIRNAQMDESVDIAFMGNFNVDEPSQDMLEAGKYLIQQGILMNHLDTNNLRVVAHNQTEITNSPGSKIFKEISSWKFYSDDILYRQRKN